MNIKEEKIETNMIRIDQLITTLIFINPTLIKGVTIRRIRIMWIGFKSTY